VLWIATGEDPAGPGSAFGPELSTSTGRTLSLTPGATIHVRIRLEHRHVLHGDYDPLLGVRTLELALGAARLLDAIPLDHEDHVAVTPPARLEPIAESSDSHDLVSAPTSLHLAAHLPGSQSYHFSEQPVRYHTKMRLRFRYRIATGSDGQYKARIMQYEDTPSTWKALSEGRIDLPLDTVGRWTNVEYTFQTDAHATTLALDFRIVGTDVGELWIDDVMLTPVHLHTSNP
jgi:hypothetical protein